MANGAKLANVKQEIRGIVGSDATATEVASALDGLFEITSYKRFRAFNAGYIRLYAMPTKTLRGSLVIDREVMVLIAPFSALQARTVKVCQEQIAAEQPRLQPNLAIVMHADPDGDEHLRVWGREASLTILPIYRPKAGAVPPATVVRQRLAKELFATDSFQVTGPVSDDNDFFGRREQAISTLRHLQAGRIEAVFGLRKVGKTSMINRIINLADDAGSPRVAMVDCSIRSFNELRAPEALKALARLARLAMQRGYAHISQTFSKVDVGAPGITFDGLWAQKDAPPLLIVLDEVDYITPESPTSPHWKSDFNEFWREFRAIVQESKRHGFSLSILVSGASSRAFRSAEIDGVENPVLHFVPESYLSPFEIGAADSMLAALGKRCGINFTKESREHVAAVCGYLPYWMRMAGSYIHRHIEVDGRPVSAGLDLVVPLCVEFAETEGAEIARVALQNLKRVDRPMFDMLVSCYESSSALLREATPLLRYGLVRKKGNSVSIESDVVRNGLELLLSEAAAVTVTVAPRRSIELDEGEWAEELATISRRRNVLERKTREFVRLVLKMALRGSGKSWVDGVLAALPGQRRTECAGLAPDALMGKLYWIELGSIIGREWTHFQTFFNDKKRLQVAFELLNERPDAHAKDVDLADVALQRRELTWLEERITQ